MKPILFTLNRLYTAFVLKRTIQWLGLELSLRAIASYYKIVPLEIKMLKHLVFQCSLFNLHYIQAMTSSHDFNTDF